MLEQSLRTWIEIDRAALLKNAAFFSRLVKPAQLMAVIKSNAYGHGLSLVATVLAKDATLWFGVDSIVEANRLRRDGIKNPILVLGYTLFSRIEDAARGRITLTISSAEQLAALFRARKHPDFHIKFDTGMHRQGFQEYELPKLILLLKKYRLTPAGAYSHLASGDMRAFSREQRARFDRMIAVLREAGFSLPLIHLNATSGTLHDGSRQPYSLARVGMGLYGYNPSRVRHGTLQPVLSWKTIIGEVKTVKKGETIGYDRTETLRRDTRLAVLPIGYWHGFDRGLSSRGNVLIRGKRARVLGRVCMDMVVVDITDIPAVHAGDTATLIGHEGKSALWADEIGSQLRTTQYEILTRLNPLIRRVLV